MRRDHNEIVTGVSVDDGGRVVSTITCAYKFFKNQDGFVEVEVPAGFKENPTDFILQDGSLVLDPNIVPYDVVKYEVNRCLAETDWTQMPDTDLSPKKVNEFRQYRKKLRTLKDTYEPAVDVKYPDKPTTKESK